MSIHTASLPAGQVLTVTAVFAAIFYALTDSGPGTPVAIAAGDSYSVGPFGTSKVYATDSERPPTIAYSTPDPLSDADTLVSPVLTTPDINGGTADALTSLSMANDVLFLRTAGVPVDYTDGSPPATGEATAGIGSLCFDYTNGNLYINGGTKAQPVWKLVTRAA